MVGTKIELVAYFNLKKGIDTSRFTSYNYIIHHENLCAKSLGFENIMKFVTNIVNFIQARALNHRQFFKMCTDKMGSGLMLSTSPVAMVNLFKNAYQIFF